MCAWLPGGMHGYTHAWVKFKCDHALVSNLQDGKVMDSVMVIKDKHGPEAWL